MATDLLGLEPWNGAGLTQLRITTLGVRPAIRVPEAIVMFADSAIIIYLIFDMECDTLWTPALCFSKCT